MNGLNKASTSAFLYNFFGENFFEEKPILEKPVSIGISVLKGQMLEEMKKLKGKKNELDFMGEVLPYLLKKKKPVYGYLSDAFWYDVLSTEAYEKLDPELVEEKFKTIID